MTSEPGERPMLSVLAGRPTAEELAALTAVVAAQLAARQQAARAEAARAAAAPAPSGWLDRAARCGAPHTHGPGAWRRSSLPR